MVDGKLSLNGFDQDQLEALVVEFEFYSIDVPEALFNLIHPPTPPVKWEMDCEHDGRVDVTKEGMCVTNVSQWSNSAKACGETNCNRFSVRIDNRGETGGINVGLYDVNSFIYHSGHYSLWLDDGSISRLSSREDDENEDGDDAFDEEYREYTTPAVNGDVITMIREGSTISFKKNGVCLGEAFTDVPEDIVLCPFIQFSEKHQQVTSLPTPF